MKIRLLIMLALLVGFILLTNFLLGPGQTPVALAKSAPEKSSGVELRWAGNMPVVSGDTVIIVPAEVYTISGRVADADDNAIADVVITTDTGLTVTSGSDGNYAFTDVVSGTAYTLTPTKSGYSFDPPLLDVSVPPDATDQNFTGTLTLTSTIVAIEPPKLALSPAEEGSTNVQVKNVSNLYGVEFILTFDPAIVEVIDAGPNTSGTQIAVGELFTNQEYFNAVNLVQDGVISFAATLKGAASPISGTGTMASIDWKAIKPGESELILEEVKLSEPPQLPDQGKKSINHHTENGLIIVAGDPANTTIAGQVLLQSRADHSGTNIFLTEPECTKEAQVFEQAIVPGIPATQTDSAGNFTITSFPGRTYRCLQAIHQGYIIGQQSLPANTQDLGTIHLAGGDVTEDDEIDIFDLAYIATRFHSNNEVADINADGLVDIFDLVIAAGNYDRSGPQAWPSSQQTASNN